MNLTDTPERSPLDGTTTSRRNLFRIGGLTLATGVLVAACGSDEPVAHTGGTLAPELTPRDTEQSVATLVRTAQSIEHLLVAAYATVEEGGWVTDSALTGVFAQLVANHEDHITALDGLASDAGVESYDEPNAYLQATVVDPVITSMADLDDDEDMAAAAIDLLYGLESLAMQTYVRSVGMFPEASQRGTVAELAGADGRHVAAIVAERGRPLPFDRIPVGNAAAEDALVHEDGPATAPPTTIAPTEDGAGDD